MYSLIISKHPCLSLFNALCLLKSLSKEKGRSLFGERQIRFRVCIAEDGRGFSKALIRSYFEELKKKNKATDFL